MKEKNKFNKEKGITLVALVITIVILIILATVAINFAFGNNGLINRAEDAKKYYANDTAYTDEALANVESYINGLTGGKQEKPRPTTVEEARGWGILGEITELLDSEGNKVKVPAEFGVAEDSEISVKMA